MILGPEEVTVTRRASALDQSTGQFGQTAIETFTVVASVQPAPGRVLELLPEGARLAGTLRAFVDSRAQPLRAANQAAGTLADLVTRSNGERYEVHTLGDWSTHRTGVPNRQYAFVRIGADEAQ